MYFINCLSTYNLKSRKLLIELENIIKILYMIQENKTNIYSEMTCLLK